MGPALAGGPCVAANGPVQCLVGPWEAAVWRVKSVMAFQQFVQSVQPGVVPCAAAALCRGGWVTTDHSDQRSGRGAGRPSMIRSVFRAAASWPWPPPRARLPVCRRRDRDPVAGRTARVY